MFGRTLLMTAWLVVVTAAESGPCKTIALPQCRGLPYKTTPLLGSSSESAAGRAIDARTGAFNTTNCLGVLTLVACAVYVPPCGRVAVSADICQLAQTDCRSALRRVGLSWPKLFECTTSLPQESTAVSVLRTKRVPRKKKKPRRPGSIFQGIPDCKCKKQRHRIKRKQYYKKGFSYAIKATFKSAEGIEGGPFILTIHVDEVLSMGKVQISQTDLTLWTERACICPRLKVGRTYLILGFEDTVNKRLLFDSRSVALRWRQIWARKIRRWEARKSRRGRGPRRKQGHNKKSRNIKSTERRKLGPRSKTMRQQRKRAHLS